MQLLKMGGSAITKKGGWKAANRAAIAKLAGAVAGVWKAGKRELIVVHGAGSFGHALVKKYGLDGGVGSGRQKKACVEVQKACASLSAIVVSALRKKGVNAVSFAPHELIVSENRRIKRFNSAPVYAALKQGKLPVLYGDMVPDGKLGFSVCSGDQIIAYLGKKAERVVFATNVDGVLAEGKVVPLITRRNFASIKRHLGGSSAADVTGGMAGKVKEIMRIGKTAYVVNAARADRVKALLLGKKAVCTEIKL